jgi:hypothetical protein
MIKFEHSCEIQNKKQNRASKSEHRIEHVEVLIHEKMRTKSLTLLSLQVQHSSSLGKMSSVSPFQNVIRYHFYPLFQEILIHKL